MTFTLAIDVPPPRPHEETFLWVGRVMPGDGLYPVAIDPDGTRRS